MKQAFKWTRNDWTRPSTGRLGAVNKNKPFRCDSAKQYSTTVTYRIQNFLSKSLCLEHSIDSWCYEHGTLGVFYICNVKRGDIMTYDCREGNREVSDLRNYVASEAVMGTTKNDGYWSKSRGGVCVVWPRLGLSERPGYLIRANSCTRLNIVFYWVNEFCLFFLKILID